jgi:hypothetical protein
VARKELDSVTLEAKQRLHESFRRYRDHEEWEAREKLREYRRRVWLARPFWFLCWCAAWWPACAMIMQSSIEIDRGDSVVVAWIGLATGLLSQALLVRLVYRPNGDDGPR